MYETETFQSKKGISQTTAAILCRRFFSAAHLSSGNGENG